METLLSQYMPLVIFIGVALVIGIGLLVVPYHRRVPEPRSREALAL